MESADIHKNETNPFEMLGLTFGLTGYQKNGTNPFEVFGLTFVVPLTSLLFTLLTSQLPAIIFSVKVSVETILLNLMLLLCTTTLSSHLIAVLVLLYALVLISWTLLWLKTKSQTEHDSFVSNREISDSNVAPLHLTRDFVRDYRGHLLLATCISILAVDFPIFPRKFSKTETYGWSVMDAGVGSFVFIHGVCSGTARLGTTRGFLKSLLSSLPLFLLGFIRLVAVAAVGYHTVVPEYGVHWNFFFTLAFTKVVCSIVFCILPPSKAWLLATLTLLVHQILLSGRLTSFVLSGDHDRSNLFSANKEGICSLLGFIAIYFEGVQLGRLLWQKRSSLKDYCSLLLLLCSIGVCGWVVMYGLHNIVQPVSRRMANLPYCIWVVTLTSLQLGVHLGFHLTIILISKYLKNSAAQKLLDARDCILWKAINYNGLVYFLIGNLLTGLVNLSVNTESADTRPFVILGMYLMALSVSVIFLHKFSIQIKFW